MDISRYFKVVLGKHGNWIVLDDINYYHLSSTDSMELLIGVIKTLHDNVIGNYRTNDEYNPDILIREYENLYDETNHEGYKTIASTLSKLSEEVKSYSRSYYNDENDKFASTLYAQALKEKNDFGYFYFFLAQFFDNIESYKKL